MKRLVTILVLVCMVCSFLCACETQKKITDEEAVRIVLKDLGKNAVNSKDPHVHTGTYENETCYNIFITVNGESWAYVISMEGEILQKGLGGHSH